MELALPPKSCSGKPCRSTTSPRGARCRIIHRRGIHPTSSFLFYSIRDARRRNNSVAGSLSPDSCRVRRMPTTAELGQKLTFGPSVHSKWLFFLQRRDTGAMHREATNPLARHLRLESRCKARSIRCSSEPGGSTRDRPTGQLSTCVNGNVTCGSPTTPAMLMRQSVGRVKPAKLDSTPSRGAMSDVVGMQITPSSPMRFWTNVRSAAPWVRASCHASDILQQDVEIQGGAAPEIQCMRLQKDLSGPSPLVVQQREEFPFCVELGGGAELR